MKRVLIGTGANCDYKIVDKTVSRQHAELMIKDDGTCLIIDRVSMNGTFVCDHSGQSRSGWRRITQETVSTNEIVLLGTYKLSIAQVVASLQKDVKPKPKPEKFIRDENGHIIPAN
ncbi:MULTISPECIES: FHA domain-containing protein [Nitrincola]|uniref:FHA domain-containing protein n=1 Tax=Nitrincola nitratireducens TaxID=1229521 RepID=W9UYU4_9GAMM|nr:MULTISPECIES: FHA domain-containing protein [Nitrincola]EXJ09082.1 hypothetical protein D791_03988 [Nitrincola nitratireducens]